MKVLRRFFCAVFFACACFFATAENTWTLAAQKFEVKQTAFGESALDAEAELIPKIILEQISQDFTREIPNEELYRRKQNKLLTDRLALFLQLSKEMRSRDSLVISESSPRKLKKKIAAQDEKIAEIKKHIADNLSEAEKLAAEENAAAESAKNELEADFGGENQKKPPFLRFFAHKNRGQENRETEKVLMYKSDSSELFSVSDEIKSQGIESFAYSKAAQEAEIDGLIIGSISSYGEYASVTAELRVFPSGTLMGCVTEIGAASDTVQIAKNLAHALMPSLSNSMPIRIAFDIEPKSANDAVSLSLDGVVFPELPKEIFIDAGIHTFSIEADGFDSEIFSYNFQNKSDFSIKVELNTSKSEYIEVYLKKSLEGVLYANGIFAGEIDDFQRTARVKINGENIIGQFSVPSKTADGAEKSLSAYFFVPSKKIADGDFVSFRAKPVDVDSLIDKSRKRMYTSYTLLVMSLPVAFYCYGKFDEGRKSYNLEYTNDADYVKKWQKYSWGFFGLSAVLGVNFGIQLARYLHTASKVLPVTAKKSKSVQNTEKPKDIDEVEEKKSEGEPE